MLLIFLFHVAYSYTNWAFFCACWAQIITMFRGSTFFFRTTSTGLQEKLLGFPYHIGSHGFFFSSNIPFTVRYVLIFPLNTLKYLCFVRLIIHCNNHWWLLGRQKQEILEYLCFRQMLQGCTQAQFDSGCPLWAPKKLCPILIFVAKANMSFSC